MSIFCPCSWRCIKRQKGGLLWLPAIQLVFVTQPKWDPLMTLPGWHHSEASASEKQSSQRANTHISAPRVQNSSHTSLAAIKIKFPFPPTTLYSPFFPSLCCCGPFHSHVFCVNPSPVFIPICFFFISVPFFFPVCPSETLHHISIPLTAASVSS